MSLTIVTGLPGAGKSKHLIERVNAATAVGREVATFTCSASSWGQYTRSVGMLDCRVPGLACPLTHCVSTNEAAATIARLAAGALAAFEEAGLFGPYLARSWSFASDRGVEVIAVSPSHSQLELLAGYEHSVTHLEIACERCFGRKADTFILVESEAGHETVSLCMDCDREMRTRGRRELVSRLRSQDPRPTEEVIEQPVELEECLGWLVAQRDASAKTAILRSVIGETGLPESAEPGSSSYLDLVCGSGYFCEYVRRLGFAYVEGVDPAPRQILVARLLATYVRGGRNRFVIADIEDYLRDTRNESFDVTSWFGMPRWLSTECSVDRLIRCLELLFAKTSRICVIEAGDSFSESGEQPSSRLKQHSTEGLMRERGGFPQVRVFRASEWKLRRDLLVGTRA
jgi:SAM-dependent methyltransferase